MLLIIREVQLLLFFVFLRESQIEISPNYISQVQPKLFVGGSNTVTPQYFADK